MGRDYSSEGLTIRLPRFTKRWLKDFWGWFLERNGYRNAVGIAVEQVTCWSDLRRLMNNRLPDAREKWNEIWEGEIAIPSLTKQAKYQDFMQRVREATK